MMRKANFLKFGLAASLCLTVGVVTGCETIKDNPRATGTAAGAGAGALAGSAIAGKGQKTEGAVIGGAVGAGAGWLAADQIDKHSNDNDNKDRRRSRDDRYYDDASSRTRQPDPYDRF
jgi:uncharacterized protein YcfJ